MEKKCSYSVVIRTLGNSGEKYQALLQSIQKQTIQPEEIIVVIPLGCEIDFQTGNERILYSEKGMVTQRAVGINAAKSEYILVVDDDIKFSETMVEELYDYLCLNNLDCCLPMEGVDDTENDMERFEYPLFLRIRGAFTGQFFISKKPSDYLDKITITAGHKVYVEGKYKDNCYYCQTGNFQCHFIKTSKAQEIHFEKETWLQNGTISNYAAYDDPAYYYQLYLRGAKIAYSLRTRYLHLDAAAGRPAKSKLVEKQIRYYTIAKNRTIFWYKFIWKSSKGITQKMLALFGGVYGSMNYALYTIIINLRPKYIKSILALFIGYKEAFTYILKNK